MGARAGVPTTAAVCDPANALKDFDPMLSQLCSDPSVLMKPVEERPEPRKPFAHLDASYPELVAKAVDCGLQSWGDEHDAVSHLGKAQHSGGFAVPKDGIEDRWISPLEYPEHQ